MSDANWTPAAIQQAIALWVDGKDVAEIAQQFGVAPGEVLSRIAKAAIAGEDSSSAAGHPIGAAIAPSAPVKSSASQASGAKAAAGKAPVSKPAASRAAKTSTAAATSEPLSTDGSAKASPAPRTVPKRLTGEIASIEGAAPKPVAVPAPVAQPGGPARAAVPSAPRPVPLRLVPTPPAPAADAVPDAPPAVARGYEAVALPAPVRTSKRLLVAADGGAGVPFMKATTLDCHFPLWADTETVSIERKRVCGCRALAGKSWCAHHLSAVFEPPRKPQPRVA